MGTKNIEESLKFLEEICGGPLTIGGVIRSTRYCEEMSLDEFAKLLGISKSHLCDIEKGRKNVSPERAYKFAKITGYSEKQWVKLALQGMLDSAGLDMEVKIA